LHVEFWLAATVDEDLPASQLTHADVASVSSEYVPAVQLVHVVEASDSTYLPAAQLVHVEFVVALTAAEVLPGAHAMQAEEPKLSLYVPAGQLLQIDVSEVSVKSSPCTMESTIADVVAVLRYSSTTNTPAMLALRWECPECRLLPK
jgi:hypothetical protein